MFRFILINGRDLIAEDVNSPLEIDIYPNSITIVNWEEGALAIDIQSKTIRDSMQLWREDECRMCKLFCYSA